MFDGCFVDDDVAWCCDVLEIVWVVVIMVASSNIHKYNESDPICISTNRRRGIANSLGSTHKLCHCHASGRRRVPFPI